jgi:2'-5' RNA ligase
MQNLKTLYVYRPLLNAKELEKWAESQGFEKILDPSDMHITIAFSKENVDWKNFKPRNSRVSIKLNSSTIKQLGEDAVVVAFDSDILQKRWKEFKDGGCSWDWPTYQPHVSITYHGSKLDLKKLKPYNGELVFGPEIFKEIDPDWKEKVKDE